MANVQKMHNDLERSGDNDRKRMESQLQLLESQTYVYALLHLDLTKSPTTGTTFALNSHKSANQSDA